MWYVGDRDGVFFFDAHRGHDDDARENLRVLK